MKMISVIIGGLGTVSSKSIGKEAGGIVNQRKNRKHAHNSIVEIGENTKKSLGDQKRLLLRSLQ